MRVFFLFALALGFSLSACSDSSSGGGDGGAPDVMSDLGDAGGGGTFSSIPNPALVVANGGAGTVSIIDPASLTVVSSVSVAPGMHPHHVGLAPDRSRVLITATSLDLSMGHGAGHMGHGGGAASTIVYQLDVASRALTAVITVQATAHNATFIPDGSTIVLSMMEHGMIAGYNASTFAEAFSVLGFEMPLEVTPTHVGSLLVSESGAARVALVDLGARTVSTRFDVGAVPVAAWASGRTNYYVSVEEGMVVRHLVEDDITVTLDTHTIDVRGMPGQAILTPDGSELWIAVEDRSVIAVVDGLSHAPLVEIPAGTKPHGIAFDPTGARAFVTDEQRSRLLVIDVAARSVSSEIAVGSGPNGIAWLER